MDVYAIARAVSVHLNVMFEHRLTLRESILPVSN